MSFVDAIKTCITKKYANFTDRARRSEFWYFALFNFLLSLVIGILFRHGTAQTMQSLVSLALLVPNIAVSIRRLHDTGRSGWHFLWYLLPVVGWIILIVFYVQDSQPGSNEWGNNPKIMEIPQPEADTEE